MNKKIYFISGLGANELAFSKLGHLPNFEKVMVKWIPNEKKESIESYAKRLIEKYDIQKGQPVVGLSFGGILAQEICRILDNKSVILISSFRKISDLRTIFKVGLNMGLYRLILPVKIPLVEYLVAYYLNSGNSINSKVLKRVLRMTDYTLMVWSIHKVAELKKDNYSNLKRYNVKGTKDRIISQWTNNNTTNIEGGSHFMVYDQAATVTQALMSILESN